MRRTWCAASLLAVAVTVGPVPAGHAADALAGDTTITATSTSRADLTLADDAVLDMAFSDASHTNSTYWERRDLDLRGDGRLIAFVLRRVGDTYPAVVATRYGFCHAAGCTPVNGGFFDLVEPFDQNGDLQLTLPAGAYVATLVTDGAPVTVQLHLSGVTGTSTVTATDPVGVTRWHPGFARIGDEQVVLDQTTSTVPSDALILAGWAYMFDARDVVTATVGKGCQHPGPAIDPIAGDYPGCVLGYVQPLFASRTHEPGINAELVSPATDGFVQAWTEPIYTPAPGPWTFSYQAVIRSGDARWGLGILVVPM